MTSVVCCYNEIICCYNEMICHYNHIISRYNIIHRMARIGFHSLLIDWGLVLLCDCLLTFTVTVNNER